MASNFYSFLTLTTT